MCSTHWRVTSHHTPASLAWGSISSLSLSAHSNKGPGIQYFMFALWSQCSPAHMLTLWLFFNLYLERSGLSKHPNAAEYQLSSGSISINQRWNTPLMMWNTLNRHFYSYSKCLETPRWSANGLWDLAMKEESPTALHSWIDYRSLCTLSKDLRSYSAAESEGLYTCCWVLSLTTVHHTKQVVLHCNVHLLLCDRFIKAKLI